MNVTEMSRKNFSLKNIWKNASFMKTTTYLRWTICGLYLVTQSDFSCLFTFLVRKKNFLWKTTPTHFMFSWMCQGHFCHFWKFLLVNLKPVFLRCLGTHRIPQEAERVNFSTQNGLTRLVLWFKQKKVQKNMCEKYVRCGLKIPLLTILDQHFVLWWADD